MVRKMKMNTVSVYEPKIKRTSIQIDLVLLMFAVSGKSKSKFS